MPTIIEAHKSSFDRLVDNFFKELQGIRTGRATPALLENIIVSAYGAKTKLVELASILVSDPQTLLVQPWDKGITNDIIHSLGASQMGFSSGVSQNAIRVSIPPLTEETRKQIAKTVNEKLQEELNNLRRVRDLVREEVLKSEREKKITEDERYRLQEQLDKTTRDYQKKLEEMKDKKVAEIMRV